MKQLLLVAITMVLLAGVHGRAGEPPSVEAQTPGENGKIAYEFDGGISVITPGTTGGAPFVSPGLKPAWSADGRRLAYTEDSHTLVVVNEDGSARMDISLPGGVDTPSWSPDGNFIVFSDGLDLFTVEVGQTTLFNVVNITNTPNPVRELRPEWGSSGTRIAYLYIDETGQNIAIRPVGGSNVTHVAGSEKALTLSWSPDESRFAFTKHDNADIFVVNATGGTATNLTNTPDTNEIWPHWSPDGRKITYTYFGNQTGALIKIMDANGSNITDVTQGYYSRWQPIRPVIQGVEFTQGIQELQTVFELQSDLAADNQPPVPIVAGKPAAMRIYFGEVATSQSFNLEIDGTTIGSSTMTPGCDPAERRRQENNCRSIEYYFTPPSGTWAIHVVVRDFANDVVFDETFTITSIETDSVILKAVSVCDHKGPGLLGQWQCQDPARLMQIVSNLRKVLPTTNVSVALPGTQVRRDTADFNTEGAWWAQVMTDLASMYGLNDQFLAGLGVETIYYGVTRNTLQAPAAYVRNTHVAASRANYTDLGYEAIQGAVMHGVGQALGLPYNNTSVPALSGGTGCQSRHIGPVSWPYADNLLRSGAAPEDVEVGFDVFVGKAVPGDKVFDMMGLCFSPGPNTAWLSPFNLNKLLGPVGPLRARSRVVSGGVTGDFWLITGTLDDQAADVGPIWTLEAEASADAGSGTHRIEILDGSETVLFTRMFTPAEVEASEESAPITSIFSELVPVQAGAARLRILDDAQAVLADFALDGDTPSVDNITLPATFAGMQPLSWSVSDPDGSGHTYWVDYSPDGGATWVNLAMNLEDTGLAVDFDSLSASEGDAVFRVIASDGVNSGELVSAAFSVSGKAPHGEIAGPSGTFFREGQLVMLEAAAWDVDDGTLDDGVTWSSSRDGALGSGASLAVYDLSVGSHTITMIARDSDDHELADSVTITVSNAPTSEGEPDVLSGDINCSGAVDSVDGLGISRHVAGLAVGQTEPCPDIGTGTDVFGDVNCDDAVTAVDSLFVLRHVAGFAVNLPGGCREIGT